MEWLPIATRMVSKGFSADLQDNQRARHQCLCVEDIRFRTTDRAGAPANPACFGNLYGAGIESAMPREIRPGEVDLLLQGQWGIRALQRSLRRYCFHRRGPLG